MGGAVSASETGIAIREVLREAWEHLRGNGERVDYAEDWRYYNILSYRYFSNPPLKNEAIASRIGFSPRQYYRERNEAIEELLNVLIEMETRALMDAGT